MDFKDERVWKIEEMLKRVAHASGIFIDDLYPEDVPGPVTPDE